MISSFAYEDDAMAFSGAFGAWRITTGGSNSLLNFAIPLADAKFRSKLTSQTTDISGIVPVMQLQLAFIENTSVTNDHQLRFDLRVVGNHPGDTTAGAVTTVMPDSSGILAQRDSSGIVGAMLHDALPKLLIANKARLAFVFASVNMVPPGAASGLAPKRFVYHYQQPASGGPGFLAILSSVSDRDVSHLQQAVDPALLQGTYDLYYLLAPSLFLKNVVMPGLPGAFGHGANAGNFRYAAGAVRNNGTLGADSKKVGLIDYDPDIDTLVIDVSADQLVSSASGSFDITGLANAYVTFSISSRNTISFDRANETVSFNADPSPNRQYDKHIPWYDYALAAIGGPVVTLVVDVVIKTVTDAVASSVSGSVGGGNLSVANMATQSIKFAGLNTFQVEDAGLSDGFYMRGRYKH